VTRFIYTASRTPHTDLLILVSSFGAIRGTDIIPIELLSQSHMAEETPFTAPVEILEEGPSEPDPKEPPNFDQINAMYTTFSTKRKELHPTLIPTNDDHPTIEPWQSDLEGLTEGAAQEMPEDVTLPNKPTKKNMKTSENPDGLRKQKPTLNTAFYNESFMFKETEWSVHNLVASPFTT
ncbi:hypothetical protein Tco_1536994, partial [Tanacetum coccineum]